MFLYKVHSLTVAKMASWRGGNVTTERRIYSLIVLEDDKCKIIKNKTLTIKEIFWLSRWWDGSEREREMFSVFTQRWQPLRMATALLL